VLLFSYTGKSSAIQYAAQVPLENLDFTDAIISKTTSSGLVKLIAKQEETDDSLSRGLGHHQQAT